MLSELIAHYKAKYTKWADVLAADLEALLVLFNTIKFQAALSMPVASSFWQNRLGVYLVLAHYQNQINGGLEWKYQSMKLADVWQSVVHSRLSPMPWSAHNSVFTDRCDVSRIQLAKIFKDKCDLQSIAVEDSETEERIRIALAQLTKQSATLIRTADAKLNEPSQAHRIVLQQPATTLELQRLEPASAKVAENHEKPEGALVEETALSNDAGYPDIEIQTGRCVKTITDTFVSEHAKKAMNKAEVLTVLRSTVVDMLMNYQPQYTGFMSFFKGESHAEYPVQFAGLPKVCLLPKQITPLLNIMSAESFIWESVILFDANIPLKTVNAMRLISKVSAMFKMVELIEKLPEFDRRNGILKVIGDLSFTYLAGNAMPIESIGDLLTVICRMIDAGYEGFDALFSSFDTRLEVH